jgi:glucose-6-phosphate 1-dehydrogenase
MPRTDDRQHVPHQVEREAEPFALVIFGATGDLAHRKLIPALYNLAADNLLPKAMPVVGFARSKVNVDAFKLGLYEALSRHSRRQPIKPAVWRQFADTMHYLAADYADPAGYDELRTTLQALDERLGTRANRLFYLATPPSVYTNIVRGLGDAGLAGERAAGEGWSRVIIEKPFGRDLATARELNRQIHAVLSEDQVYRIDHFLGKEAVQNLLVLRFANGIFEPLWDRRNVDSVQITAAETVGVEGRGGYYEESGAARDMVQSHLLQLFSLVAMEPPVNLHADAIRDEKVKALQAVRSLGGDEALRNTVRGQYAASTTMPGYLEERGVAPNSTTETYVAAKLFVDNWRWAGVPFYLRTGKRMPERVSEIAVQFRRPPNVLFGAGSASEANTLLLRIQPDEGMALRVTAKVPGPTAQLRQVDLDFHYQGGFGVESPDAYERLLLDAMLGDPSLFTRHDETEAAWSLVNDLIGAWSEDSAIPLHPYKAGTWGPAAASVLLRRDGHRWRNG